MKLERRSKVPGKEFVEEYLVKNRPVIITDGMDDWLARRRWTPEFFEKEFGDEKVQVYNDGFRLIGIQRLRDYFMNHFNNSVDGGKKKRRGYVRWLHG